MSKHEHISDGSTSNPSRLICKKCGKTYTSADEQLRETIERLLRFNCPNGCDGNGSYPEVSSDGEWEQGQCQWCFEYGMPTRDAIQALIRTEELKLLAEVRERVMSEDEPGVTNIMIAAEHAEQRNVLTKMEAEL